MITSAKTILKNKRKKFKKRTDRTLRQMVKAKLYRQNHIKKHTHKHSRKEKKEKYISFGKCEVFHQHSVGVLKELFHM